MAWRTLYSKIALGLWVFWGIVGHLPIANAQETEPNHPCTLAQDLGAVALPYSLTSSLDSTQEFPDVDFFRFTGTPGVLIKIDLQGATAGHGTLGDPYLGAFDAGCNLIAFSDDFMSLDSQLTMAIPADGTLILGATLCCDASFLGGGVGSYRLSLSPVAPIRSISGRIVGTDTGLPLPFAYAQLFRCDETGCAFTAYQNAGSDGRFLFTQDLEQQPLSAGVYWISADGEGYARGETERFEVLAGEAHDVGDIALTPLPVSFQEIRPCAGVPAEGGRCLYSVRIANVSPNPLAGAAWSVVTATGTGSMVNYTSFQANLPRRLTLDPGASQVVWFAFDVPATVEAGASICAQIFFGDDSRQPYFNPVAEVFPFCVTKAGGAVFSVVPDKRAGKGLRPMRR